MILADILQIGAYPVQGLHLSPESAVIPVLYCGKGGQQPQTAVDAAQIPVLPAAQMVQQALVVAVEDDPHVKHAGVYQIAQHKVDHPVPAAEGHRGGRAVLRQLPQGGILIICKNQSVQAFHLRTSSWQRLSMVLGDTVSPSAMTPPGPMTEIPHRLGS